MENRWIRDNGIRNYPKDVVAWMRAEEGVSLGVGMDRMLSCTGPAYREGTICSFMELHDAFAISMTNTEELTFLSGEIDRTAERGVLLVNEFAFGNGSAYPQPNGQFDLYCQDRKLLSFSMKKTDHFCEQNGIRAFFQVKKRRLAAYGDHFSLDELIRDECAFINGLLFLHIPKDRLADLPKPLFGSPGQMLLSVRPVNADQFSRRWFRLGLSPVLTLMTDLYQGAKAVLHGVERPLIAGKPVFFGDIHIHSWDTTYLDDTGCGRKSVEENYAYARDVAGCDFAAVTDHDWQMNADDWRRQREVTERMHDEGRFVTLHAFEWTSSNYGHRNVYFRGVPQVPDGLTPFDYRANRVPVKYGGGNAETDPTPYDLHAWLERNGLEAITVPHHPNAYQFPMDLRCFFNEKYDRAVEVYSNWGSMMDARHPVNQNVERIDALGIMRYVESGPRFAFIASSDSHDGNGGDSNVSRYKKQFAHCLGSGRIAVPAGELTRESLYQALWSRHVYAVTGEPILLSFCINGAQMGDVIQTPCEQLAVAFEARGTDRLACVRLMRNGRAARVFEADDTGIQQAFALPVEKGWYWLEVTQADGEMAWSSPIWYEPDGFSPVSLPE